MAGTMTLSPRIARWMEPIPAWAGPEWCLPAVGGRVLIRGYDTHRNKLTDLNSTWGLDETHVPVTDATTAGTDGPGGEVHPGDCVVFIGRGEDFDEPVVWYPQRVVHAEAGPRGWQRVWAVRYFHDASGPMDEVTPAAIPAELMTPDPLHGDGRRLVLERFGLNLDCEHCGSRGRRYYYGSIIDPMPPDVKVGGPYARSEDPRYWCLCTAKWRVSHDGTLTLHEPLPIM